METKNIMQLDIDGNNTERFKCKEVVVHSIPHRIKTSDQENEFPIFLRNDGTPIAKYQIKDQVWSGLESCGYNLISYKWQEKDLSLFIRTDEELIHEYPLQEEVCSWLEDIDVYGECDISERLDLFEVASESLDHLGVA